MAHVHNDWRRTALHVGQKDGKASGLFVIECYCGDTNIFIVHVGWWRYASSMTAALLVNSFTDASPSFPYQSSEARAQLGIPDVPAIHLAITQLAESLLALSLTQYESEANGRILALRCASYGVLMKYSFESVKMRFKEYLSLPVAPDAFEQAELAESVDWLGNAIAVLGIDDSATSVSVRQKATPYGWAA